MWYFRYHVLHMKQDGTWKPGNKRTLIPNVSRVTGPGMIPFAATLAPNLFDMPGSDKRPAKRMRTDIDTDGTSLGNSTTSTHRRHAVVVTDFLQESSSSWKFLEKFWTFSIWMLLQSNSTYCSFSNARLDDSYASLSFASRRTQKI